MTEKNLKMKKISGFTLIETLVVIFLLGLVLVVGSNLFFNILKGASKAEIEKEVKQNGDYAMAIMERMIKNSIIDGVDCTSTPGSLTVESLDGGFTTFVEDDDKIASSGAYLTGDNLSVSNLSFVCDDNNNPRSVVIGFSLTPRGVVSTPETWARIDFNTTVTLRNIAI
jgi:prepilin-type N-terminal cleavage/methylation domain-containing protein